MVVDDLQLKGEMPKSLVTIEKAADYLEQAGESSQTKPSTAKTIWRQVWQN
jgi:hypothetical protein